MPHKAHKFRLSCVAAVMSVFCALSLLAAPPSTAWTVTGVSAVASSAAKAKNCIVRVRKENLHDWMPYSSAMADCEPDYAPSRTFGVWREGSRKAYLVSLPQETLGLSVHLY